MCPELDIQFKTGFRWTINTSTIYNSVMVYGPAWVTFCFFPTLYFDNHCFAYGDDYLGQQMFGQPPEIHFFFHYVNRHWCLKSIRRTKYVAVRQYLRNEQNCSQRMKYKAYYVPVPSEISSYVDTIRSFHRKKLLTKRKNWNYWVAI